MPEADHVLVRGPVEDERADGHQSVKPASGLVDGFTDVLSRISSLESLLAARHMRVAVRGERHRTGVVPSVDHLRNSGRLVTTVGTGECDRVDVRTVWV